MDIIKESYQKSTASSTKSFDDFWRDGLARVPISEAESSWVRHGDFRADPDKNPLATASGKIELYCEKIAKMNIPDCPPMATWMEPSEYLGNAKPKQVHVVSPHPYNRIHSQFAQADLRHELNVQDREFALINAEDAKERGIADGDLVELSNERGKVIVGARVSDKIMPGVTSVYEGAWLSWDRQGRCNSGSVNTITSSRRASGLSQATTANTCLVDMKKASNLDGPNKAYEPPASVKSDVRFSESDYGLNRIGAVIVSALDEMEEGAKIYYQKCSLCHTPRDPGSHTYKEWESITQSMFLNAGATPEERKLILSFLKANAKPGI